MLLKTIDMFLNSNICRKRVMGNKYKKKKKKFNSNRSAQRNAPCSEP